MNHHEEMIDAQSKCVPCKLCGGSAKITDAGIGWGYHISCENASVKRERIQQGCMVGETRISGHAYNVMKLWNRLHGTPELRQVTPTSAQVEAFHRAYDASLEMQPRETSQAIYDGLCAALGSTAAEPQMTGTGEAELMRQKAISNAQQRNTLEMALRGIIDSCQRAKVGAGDGGTYIVYPPSPEALIKAVNALNNLDAPAEPRKEVMPDDQGSADARLAISPGVTAGASPAEPISRGQKFVSLTDGKSYVVVSEVAGIVTYERDDLADRHPPRYLGRDEFDKRFQLASCPQMLLDVEAEIASVVQSVNEWDDRTSPDDYPDHLLITSEELSEILRSFAETLEGRDNG